MGPPGSHRHASPAASQRWPAARSRPRRKAQSHRRDCARRCGAPRATRKSTSATCPARAARASAMAPSRSRAASDAPASSRRRASGRQPESAAANSTRLSSVDLASGLIRSSRRSSSRQVGAVATPAGAAEAACASRHAATIEPARTTRPMEFSGAMAGKTFHGRWAAVQATGAGFVVATIPGSLQRCGRRCGTHAVLALLGRSAPYTLDAKRFSGTCERQQDQTSVFQEASLGRSIMRHIRKLSGIAVLAGASAAAIAASAFAAEYSMTVNKDRLINAQNEPQNWLLMNGDYGSTRYSKLTQINRDNVKNLRMVWALALGGMQDVGQNGPENEVNPLIDNGFMYTTDGWGTVYKIDARNPNKGEFVWISRPRRAARGQRPAHARHRAVGRPGASPTCPTAASSPSTATTARSSGTRRSPTKNEFGSQETIPHRAARRRRQGPRRRTARATAARAAGSRRSTSRPATSCGAGTSCRSRATPAARPGRTDHNAWKTGGGGIWQTGSYDPAHEALHRRHRQSRSDLRPAVPARRQPLHQLGGRARRRHRQAGLALPVHAERLVGLRRGRRPHAVRHDDQRREAARSSATSDATASSTRSIAPTAASSRPRSTSTI